MNEWNNRSLFRLLWPLVAEQILAVTMGAADTIMVSSVGEAAISGVNIIDNINNLFIIAFTALSTGGAVVVSQYIGRRDADNSRLASRQLFYIVVLSALIVMVPVVLWRRPVIRVLYGTIAADVMDAAAIYFLITALSYPFLGIYNACAALFRSLGNSRIPMGIALLVNITNIAGNSFFIFGLRLGAAGAALSTLISRIIAAAILTALLVRNRRTPISLAGLQKVRFIRPMIRTILNVGIPSGLENSMFQLGRLLTQRIFTTFGTMAMAANAIAGVINSFSFMPGTAFGMGLLMFEKDFPGVREIKLEQNYRSTTTILEAANGVISNNTNRKEKTLWSGNTGGKPIELFYPENESGEADFIAARIKEIMIRERLKYDDFGVLIRTNSMTRSLEEAFLAENIPYRVSGGTSFFQRKEVKDILSYLRIIANSNDDVNLLRIINTPRRGIGKTSIATFTELARKNHSSLWDAMSRYRYAKADGQETLFHETPKAKADLDDFMTLIEFFRTEILGKGSSPLEERRGPRTTLSQKTRALVDNIDYWAYLVSEYSKNEKAARWKFANIEYLIQSIETWEKDPDNFDPSLFAYLNRVSLITRDDDDDEAGKGKVNLMTIHASKGLEFPVVFIAGAEDGIIPHARSLEEGDGNIEEERRLFYVAITRARDKLFITSCRKRRRLQNVADCVPSPFLAEIPPHLMENHAGDQVVEDPAEAADFFARIKSKFG